MKKGMNLETVATRIAGHRLRIREFQKETKQEAGQFNAKQIQEAQEKNQSAPLLTRLNPLSRGVIPQTVGMTSGKTASGVEWRIK